MMIALSLFFFICIYIYEKMIYVNVKKFDEK